MKIRKFYDAIYGGGGGRKREIIAADNYSEKDIEKILRRKLEEIEKSQKISTQKASQKKTATKPSPGYSGSSGVAGSVGVTGNSASFENKKHTIPQSGEKVRHRIVPAHTSRTFAIPPKNS